MLEQLAKSTAAYLSLRQQLSDAEKAKAELKKPARPTRIMSDGELEEYARAMETFELAEASLDSSVNGLRSQISEARKQLANDIPFSNCWFAVSVNGERLAVGCYEDSWGGRHIEFVVKDWSDDLKPLTDHDHYS